MTQAAFSPGSISPSGVGVWIYCLAPEAIKKREKWLGQFSHIITVGVNPLYTTPFVTFGSNVGALKILPFKSTLNFDLASHPVATWALW